MARITRKQKPPQIYKAYRKYLPYLLTDFEGRCAYSMQHYLRAGGLTAMEVDHHNCHLSENTKNRYSNLFLSTKHCNGHKLGRPTKLERKSKLRFLNPCKEEDYGVHIFEDPETFEVWGATPEGRYHIRYLDLNAEHLVRERKLRSYARKGWKNTGPIEIDPDFPLNSTSAKSLDYIKDEINKMIPDIIQKKKPLSGNQISK